MRADLVADDVEQLRGPRRRVFLSGAVLVEVVRSTPEGDLVAFLVVIMDHVVFQSGHIADIQRSRFEREREGLGHLALQPPLHWE